jgi:hypothetical protein
MIARRADIVIAEHPGQAAAFFCASAEKKTACGVRRRFAIIHDQNFSAYQPNFK